MRLHRAVSASVIVLFSMVGIALCAAQTSSSSAKKSSPQKQASDSATTAKGELESGAVANGVYHNNALSLSCKIPDGWVLRTDELNGREEAGDKPVPPAGADSSTGGRVLLAAFSRPPEARANDVNASILIAIEKQSAYPGLKEAAQYFGPLTEVAKAQGFTMDEDPYAIAIGSKTLVRGDFHKDVGSRVMRQSTLAFLAQGYAVSITVIGGTDDEVEDLVDGLSFGK